MPKDAKTTEAPASLKPLLCSGITTMAILSHALLQTVAWIPTQMHPDPVQADWRLSTSEHHHPSLAGSTAPCLSSAATPRALSIHEAAQWQGHRRQLWQHPKPCPAHMGSWSPVALGQRGHSAAYGELQPRSSLSSLANSQGN